jgi:hypothetical protein
VSRNVRGRGPEAYMLMSVQKVDAVLVIFEYSLLFIAAGGEMVDSTGVLYAEERVMLRPWQRKGRMSK